MRHNRSSRACALVVAMLLAKFSVAAPQEELRKATPSNAGFSYDEDTALSDREYLVNAHSPISTSDASPVATLSNEQVDQNKKKAAAEKKKKEEELKKEVATAYKDPFYLNDFSYLNNPAYQGANLGEGLKQLQVGDQGKLDIGGQHRLRYHGEHNMRGAGLTGRDDNFLLDRTRIYGDYKINKRARVFAEFLDAGSSFENFAPRQIEVQHFDSQHLFADLFLISA